MTLQPDRSREQNRRRAVAKRYKALGYEVIERPVPERLPEFLRDAAPDLIAYSESDNVVIEVKKHASLKGANDLVDLADRVSSHPDWRFELVVLDDGDDAQPDTSEAAFQRLLDEVKRVTGLKLYDIAFVYLTAVLGRTARDLAKAHGIKGKQKTDRAVLEELGFKGAVPQDAVEESLAAFSVRDSLVHAPGLTPDVSEEGVNALVRLCEHLRRLR